MGSGAFRKASRALFCASSVLQIDASDRSKEIDHLRYTAAIG